MEKTVMTKMGKMKRVIAPNYADLGAAVSLAQTEPNPKNPDINDKNDANKRYRDL